MKQHPLLTIVFALTAVTAINAQDPLSNELKQSYNGVKNNLLKAAEQMPDNAYDFKASPDIRTFGQLIAHIADAQMRTCSAFKGEAKSAHAASKTTKADLVAALQASFDECDGAYGGLTDAAAVELVKTPRGSMSKLGILMRNVIHDNEEYGYLAVYMRLKGVVPPSSARR